jgi:flagellin
VEMDAAITAFIAANNTAYSASGSVADGDLVITKLDGSSMDITQTEVGGIDGFSGGFIGTHDNGSVAEADVNYVLQIDGEDAINVTISAGDELTAAEADAAIAGFLSANAAEYGSSGSFANGDLVITKTDGTNMAITETGATAAGAGFVATHSDGDPLVAPGYSFALNGSNLDLASAIAGDDALVTGTEVAAAISAVSGFTASYSGGNLTITRTDGANFTIGEAGSDASGSEGLASSTTATYRGTVTITSTGEDLVVAGTDPSKAGLTALTTAESGNTLTVETVSGANSLITAIDSALNTVNGSRATLGAIQNRFESVVTSLQTSSESLSAARSRIQDTDFASETANLTKSQILQQAGMAMMAQANQLPQGVLSLLQ